MVDPLLIPWPPRPPIPGVECNYEDKSVDIIGLSIIVALFSSIAIGCMGINERDERAACQYEEVDE